MSTRTAPPRAATPRLVATDLDGTLVRRDGSVSAYTSSVLRALEERGVPVLFVTGRPLRWASEVFEHVGRHGIAIVSNGALAWDVGAEQPLIQKPIGDDILEVADRVRGIAPETVFGVETLHGFSMEPDYVRFTSSWYRNPSLREGPLAEIVDEPVLKLLAQAKHIDAEEFWLLAQDQLEGLAQATWSGFESVPMLEISGVGVTKASTLETIVARLGFTADDVVAFGDMPNDLPMLKWAGTSYAMADGHPRVLEAADHVAPSNEDDGVARVLAELFDL